jgi:hypothetical protein
MIRYLNLPQVPKSIIENLPSDWDQFDQKVSYANRNYVWTDSFNQEINSWCQQNVCQDMYFGFQIMRGDVPVHRDTGTLTKFVYLIYPGGKSVATNFYNDQQELAQSYVIDINRWHVLQANRLHSVDGIEPGQIRFSITGRIFP